MNTLLPALSLLAGCATPCGLEPTFVHDDGHAESAAGVERHVQAFLDWTGTRCLAEVEVSESAPEEGAHERTSDGWALAVHPDAVTAYQLNWHLCEMVRVEDRALADAPRSLFRSGDDSRTSQFLDACAAGPSDPAFVDQAQVCGLAPLTPEQAWIQDVVYDVPSPRVAPDLPVVREDPVTVPHGADLSAQLYTAGAEGLHVLAYDRATGASGLELWTPAANLREVDLPELDGRSARRIAADPERAVFLVAQDNDLAWSYDLLVVERSTGAVTWVPIPGQHRDLGSGYDGVLIGDELVLPGTGDGIPGQLHAIDTRDGQVRAIDLPAPEDPRLTAGPRSVWPDPTRPGDLLVSYVYQHYERFDYAFDGVEVHHVFDRFVARLDLETGAWETLLHTGPWGFDPFVLPLGVTADGRVAVRVDVRADGALLGAVDVESGELLVSSSVCLGEWDLPSIGLDDAVHQLQTIEDTNVWTAYRLGR